MATKVKQIDNFLGKGHEVKVTLMLVGRNQGHPERGVAFLQALPLTGRKTEPSHKGRDITFVVYPPKDKNNDKMPTQQAN